MKRPNSEDNRLRITHASAIEHFLTHQPKWIQKIETDRPANQLRGRIATLVELAAKKGIPVGAGGGGQKRADGLDSVAAVMGDFPYTDFGALVEKLKSAQKAGLVALDHIQDPQNFGAICRSAEAFGVAGAVFPKDRSVAVTSAVVNASVGAVATLPLCKVTNLGEALRKLKDAGFWIIGSDLGAESVAPWKVPDFDKWVLVIGAEGDGMSPLIKSLCDCVVQIPLAGKVQSLNASAATSALLYELTRPRITK